MIQQHRHDLGELAARERAPQRSVGASAPAPHQLRRAGLAKDVEQATAAHVGVHDREQRGHRAPDGDARLVQHGGEVGAGLGARPGVSANLTGSFIAR